MASVPPAAAGAGAEEGDSPNGICDQPFGSVWPDAPDAATGGAGAIGAASRATKKTWAQLGHLMFPPAAGSFSSRIR